jgi:DNA-directed RNA polymerase specialized sigma24 family protein
MTAVTAVDSTRHNLDNFVFAGVEAPGFWARAWTLARGQASEVEDAFQDIVLCAVEAVADDPAVTEEQPGYLLQKATWAARNKRAKAGQRYFTRRYGYHEVSLDAPARVVGSGSCEEGSAEFHEAIAAPVVDHDLRLAVRTAVKALDGRDREVALLLAEGVSKTHIAEHLGVTPAAVTYRVNKLRKHLADLIN